MSKSRSGSKSKLTRVKALPWARIFQFSAIASRRWRSMSAGDRKRLTTLLRSSRGRLGNLSAKERAELRRLAGKLDLRGAGRDLLSLFSSRGKRRKR